MHITGNTVFITGGGSGIGRGLAEAFHGLGNQVIIAGRRRQALDAVTSANPGMKALVLDIEDPASIAETAAALKGQFPGLNVVINNAGIMRREDLRAGDVETSEAIVNTNLLGPIRMTAAVLPQLLAQPSATIVNVSSGLAFVPLAVTPTYCATKAAIHSYSMSLRYQLRDTGVKVLELAPPWVATELMGPVPDNPRAMPLEDFIAETMRLLPTATDEILVERVKPLRTAPSEGREYAVFHQFNDMMRQQHR